MINQLIDLQSLPPTPNVDSGPNPTDSVFQTQQKLLRSKFETDISRLNHLCPKMIQMLHANQFLEPTLFEQTQQNMAKPTRNEILPQIYKPSVNTRQNAKKHRNDTSRRRRRRRNLNDKQRRQVKLPRLMMDPKLVQQMMYLLEQRSRTFCSNQLPKSTSTKFSKPSKRI